MEPRVLGADGSASRLMEPLSRLDRKPRLDGGASHLINLSQKEITGSLDFFFATFFFINGKRKLVKKSVPVLEAVAKNIVPVLRIKTNLNKTSHKFPNVELLYYFCKSNDFMERIIAKRTLRQFWEKHPEIEQYLKTWYATAKNADWKSPDDIKDSFASASILKTNRVVFNIKGNSFRLIVKFNYLKQWGFVRFIGTHEDYNNIDANTI